MEKIIFDEKTFIYKTKLDLSKFKDEMLAECEAIIKLDPTNPSDAYNVDIIIDDSGRINVQTRLDEIAQFGINCCLELLQNDNIVYSRIFNDNWINVIKSKPIQQYPLPGESIYHTHNNPLYTYKGEVINSRIPIPDYTYVYYIQMPDNLHGKDGILAVEGQDGTQYSILPEEGDLIIMLASLPHAPYPASNSSKDRIVVGGNVGVLV
jgi:hypothetical protein